MSTKIGQFEILSELSKSPTSIVYKANDPQSGQTIALKAIQLSTFGEHAAALEQALLAEAESTKVLSSPNITSAYGAGEIEGQFCAAMDYIQGNSIATMLARKEGFSIWDLLDIGRQLCSGLDHASSHQVVHRSLEPSKIMCGWDGTVKILSFGMSSVGDFVQYGEGLSSILHYQSPEQVRGEELDGRSNLFSLGAMFYEMVTERKAFDREDVESLKQSILESTPVAPVHVNPKIHPILSDLIMKALAKDPAERFQTGRELLDQLELCKESKPSAKKAEAPKAVAAVPKAASPQAKAPSVSAPKAPVAPVAKQVVKPTPSATKPEAAKVEEKKQTVAAVAKASKPVARAAAAGVGSGVSSASSADATELDLSNGLEGSAAGPTIEGSSDTTSYMSAAVADEPEVETFEAQPEEHSGRKMAVDPMMSEGGSKGSSGTSFSEISELPPLKEIYIAPPPPAPSHSQAPQEDAAPTMVFKDLPREEEKPKVQPREVAEKAIKEIKNVPPKLMLYALAGAGILILLIALGFTLYVHNLGSDDDSGAPRKSVPATEQAPAQTAPVSQAPTKNEAAPATVESQPAEAEERSAPEPKATASKARNAKKKAPAVAAAPAIIPGQLTVDSTPQGAQVQIDGQSDPSWVTPIALTNLQPGQHSITVSKQGYVTDTRSVEVTSGNKAVTSLHLTQMMASLIVKSDPAGASIFVDGHDVGAKTPATVSVNKGEHVVLVRMSGYIDETMNTQFVLGQTFNFSPSLRALGNADSIKTVGKMSKLFGGKGAQPGQATLSVRTQPKGAQVSINQHMLDKGSPVDAALDPGNYVVDITLTGYVPVHKVITADKGGKAVIDEVLQKQ